MKDNETSIPLFIVAAAVAGLTVLLSIWNVWRSFALDSNLAEKAGGIVGSLWSTGILCCVGFGIALYLYSMAMAAKYPDTHSDAGRLQQIHEATKEVNVTDISEDGFYANANEVELLTFYNQLVKSGVTPRLCALILEVRRRLGVQ